jgi:hypothetical protein
MLVSRGCPPAASMCFMAGLKSLSDNQRFRPSAAKAVP